VACELQEVLEHPLPMREFPPCQLRRGRFERQHALGVRLSAGAGAFRAGTETLKTDGMPGTDVISAHVYTSSSRRALICACRRRCSRALYLSGPP
jgi:hypothetical protein